MILLLYTFSVPPKGWTSQIASNTGEEMWITRNVSFLEKVMKQLLRNQCKKRNLNQILIAKLQTKIPNESEAMDPTHEFCQGKLPQALTKNKFDVVEFFI